MKKLNKFAAFIMILVVLIFLPGCVGQEDGIAPPTTEIVTVTEGKPPENECRVEIIDVFGEGFREERIERVIVVGNAMECGIVEVTIFCGVEQTKPVEVDPATGMWEAVFDGFEADCLCGQPLEVRACCLEPPVEGCCATRFFEDACQPRPSCDELLVEFEALIENCPRPIIDVKGPERDQFIGKIVTIEGYFFYISTWPTPEIEPEQKSPMLVSNLEYIQINRRIPEEKYIDLTGHFTDELMAEKGSFLHVKGTVIELEDEIWLDVIGFRVIDKKIIPWIDKVDSLDFSLKDIEIAHDKYAVLISGGWKSSKAYKRYWNDMKYMYKILNNTYRYNPANIYVIYKDGKAEDKDMPVHYSATTTNVNTVFNILRNKMTERDSLFLYTNNHGGGFDPTTWPYNFGLADNNGDEPELGYSEAKYGIDFNDDGDKYDTVQIDETLCLYYKQEIRDDALADLLNNITCKQMIIFMEQCFSGGFIHDLSAQNRIILTACGEEESSYSADTEGDYNEFAYHFHKAVNGEDWSADTNKDKNINMVEAFNYASKKDNQQETPHYDDNGDQVGHTQPIPKGGDGSTGANAYLHFP